MTELTAILRAHAAKYPLLLPRDAVKLIYQNEFGGGHLISDPARSLRRIMDELSALPPLSGRKQQELSEPLGNGQIRVFLAGLAAHSISPQCLNDWFVASAAQTAGDSARFRHKLALLQSLAEEGAFGFSAGECAAFLREYEADGLPPLSHSDSYRLVYRPAYRVILRKYLP